jgi:hypothetical protein
LSLRRLIECVTKGLQEIRFRNRYSLDYSSFRSLDSCSLALPRNVQELTSAWISPDPLRDFSYGFISENRSAYTETLSELSEGDFPIRLSEITNTAQMPVQIVDSFATLPWGYTIVLPFISVAGLNIRLKQLPLSRELIIKKGSEISLPFPSGPELSPFEKLLEPPATEWSADRLYLEATLKGYVGFGLDTETLERFYHQVRTIAGIGLAVDAFNLTYSNYATLFSPSSSFLLKPLYVYRTEGGSEANERIRYLPDRLGPIDQLGLHPSKFNSIVLLSIAFGDSDDCGRLREAGQWYFASKTEKNEIFEFVEAVVVLEILFNDKATADAVGVEKLIANRCAYLIAGSTAERQEILKHFEAIYQARSSIVHKGKSRLSKAERDSLIQARVLGSCSILKELGMIHRSQQQRTVNPS